MPTKREDLDDVIRQLGAPRNEMVERLRYIVKDALPEATEAIKWGQPVFVHKGKNLVCIMLYEDHVNLGFFVGSRMKSKRLEETGKGLRHVKVRAAEDINEKEFSRMVREAAKLV